MSQTERVFSPSSSGICEGAAQRDETRQTRGWKLLVFLPVVIPQQQLFDRFVLFNQGSWIQLLIEGR